MKSRHKIVRQNKNGDICIVFISRFDIFHSTLPLYHVNCVIKETGKGIGNGLEEVYIYTTVRDSSAVLELMKVFVDDSAYNSKFPVISNSTRRYKDKQ